MDYSEYTLAILVAMFGLTLVGALFARRRELPLRPIAAYTTLPQMAADAVESDYRLHFSMGTSAISQISTVSALASAEIIYRLVERIAISPQVPLVTVGDPVTLTLAQDTLRRAYTYRQRMNTYQHRAAVWFPTGDRSWALAAGASSMAATADVYGSVLLGRFGTELALLGESALRHNQVLIAHSDQPEGQAVAFAQANQMLYGEELYAGPAYLGRQPIAVGGLVAMDLLRIGIIVAMIITAIQAAL